MNVLDCFTKSINYIEDHLFENLATDEIAKHVYLSTSYFQRVFMVLADVGVAEYIRNRRLSLAGQEINNTNNPRITDMAYKYGYETVETFSRAFKGFHGCLPSEVKKKNVHLAYYPRLEIIISVKGGKTMNYEIMEDQEYTIVVLTKTVTSEKSSEECPKLWDDYLKKGYAEVVPPMLGVCLTCSKDNCFEYGIGSVIECVSKVPQGFKTVKIPKQTYAKFTSHGIMPKAIQQLWKDILTEWLPNSKYELVDAPEFECYTQGDTSSSNYEFSIWLPVKLK